MLIRLREPGGGSFGARPEVRRSLTGTLEADYAAALAGLDIPQGLAKAIASWDVAASKGALFTESRQLFGLIGRERRAYRSAVKEALSRLLQRGSGLLRIAGAAHRTRSAVRRLQGLCQPPLRRRLTQSAQQILELVRVATVFDYSYAFKWWAFVMPWQIQLSR